MAGNQATLKRSLSLPLLALYGLGNILGAGIYVLIGKVAGEAGANTLLAFLVAMVIAGLTALSYMELSSRFPQSASVSVYLHQAFGRRWLSVGIGLALVFGGIASAAALAQGFAGYLHSIVPVPVLLASTGLVLVLGLLAARGIAESAIFAAAITAMEVTGLLLIIWFGRDAIADTEVVPILTIDPMVGLGGVLVGAFLAFYAFIGFEDMVNVVEEVKNPRRTMPLAIALSLAAATVLYMLVVAVSMAVTSPTELSASTAPLNLVFDKLTAIDPLYISAIGVAATVNGVLVQIIMGSRILYGLSKQGWLPSVFARLNQEHQTPLIATVSVVLAILLGTFLLSLVSLASITSFLILTVFVLVNVALVVIKLHGQPAATSYITVPILLPAIAALCCFGLIAYQVVSLLS